MEGGGGVGLGGDLSLGGQDGKVVRALASHRCGPTNRLWPSNVKFIVGFRLAVRVLPPYY